MRDIRGVGLMIGIELDGDCSRVVDEAREMGVLINCTAGNVIRLVPPLVIKKEEIDAAVDVLGQVIS